MDEMEFRRVKFRLGISFCANRIVTVIENFSEDADIEDINEIIELYNIQLFFANGIFHRDWTAQQIDDYKKAVNKFSKAQGVFFAKMPIDKLNDILSIVQISYIEDFWYLVAKYKVYRRISQETFQGVMGNSKFRLDDVLAIKELVNTYPDEIIFYLENNIQYVRFLLRQYLAVPGNREKRLYFPDNLDEKKKISLIEKYIESDVVSVSYLQLICNSNGSKECPLSPNLKLKAERRYREKSEVVFQDSPGFRYEVHLAFKKDQKEICITKDNGGFLEISYGTKWIGENLDFATLLNNFIYLFGYTDFFFRSCHVLQEADLAILEKLAGVKGKRQYVTGIVFVQTQNIAQLQIMAYYIHLNRYGIQLEEVIKWFFTDYLQEEFNVKGFIFHPSTKGASYLEKCRNIAPEIDSVLKQFQLYCTEGEIDVDLLHMTSEHILIKNIPSLIHDKYIYPCGDDYKKASQLIFSNQSYLACVEGVAESYETFYEIILHEDIALDSFYEWQKTDIEWLIVQGFLFIDEFGSVKPIKNKIWVLYELYKHGVLCGSYIEDIRDVINELKNKGMIEMESSLLSRPEQDYFNYLFNKAEFDNGLDLRNRYIHGTQKIDEETNKNDYFVFLRMLVLIVIKINEEFCLING